MTVVLNEPALQLLLDSPTGAVGLDMVRRGNNIRAQVEVNAFNNFRVQSGNLLRSIKMEPRPTPFGLTVVIGCDKDIAPYAGYLEQGTTPHEIVGNPMLVSSPDNPDPLLFPRHRVNHPGNPPAPFVRPALEAGRV